MNIGFSPLNGLNYPTPYDNSRINNRHLEKGEFNAAYTRKDDAPARTIVRSTTDSGIRPKNIWRDFFQVTEGNCVTVSAIKAAMAKFGSHPEGIYKKITRTPEGYDVVMRDDVHITLTHQELLQAMEHTGFAGSGKVLRHAVFLYAASAKRAQNENNDHRASQNFKTAMDTLNDGEHPGEALTRLGLKHSMRSGTLEELKNGAIGTLANSSHSVAVIDGHIDLWSIKVPLDDSPFDSKENTVLVLA